ncbi:polyketide synthase, partial [Aureobasidium melanogenum]
MISKLAENNDRQTELDQTVPIAVVGIGCRCAGDATDPESLYDMVKKAREAWQPIPKDRYNNDAFYHPDPNRNGTSNIVGGHFLKDSPGQFDGPFFGMTSSEVGVMDPQQRLLLETSYEALENAGIPMNKLVGSDTSCFVGSFCRDFPEMQLRDTEHLPTYQPTGAGPSLAFLSNRLSYYYDCRGPSVSVDTACSASLVALHLGCQTIRTGESKMSIVGGSNVLLSHEIMIGMSAMRFLSPDGRCYSFDHRANGYARGEGAVCVVLKPLADALRDGDTIRAVIRNTGCNQDGMTNGITIPNREAQEALITSVYANAGLDPVDTTYVEAHGTGTPAGDPLETAALSSVFCPNRPIDEPLVIGSIKSNMGHLEGASGLAGLVKLILMLENKMYLPNRNFEKANPRIPLQDWKLRVLTEPQPWVCDKVRRASINSFGYGGTNAHAILDEAEGYLTSRGLTGCWRTIHTPMRLDDGPHDSTKKLFIISAFDTKAGISYAKKLSEHLSNTHRSEEYLSNLSFTLNERRSLFHWRHAFVATSAEDIASKLTKENLKFTKSGKLPLLGFVFTGQGAQWHAMGRELLQTNPVFRNTILRAEVFLREIGADWSLTKELSMDAQTTRVNSAAFSQPLCTAVQIGVVDVLAAWGIRPSSVTGHSSGEIASAYAAGALGMEDSLSVAYHRGIVASRIKDLTPIAGAMMAVGLSDVDAMPYLEGLKAGKAVIACVNSPTSITISGDASAVDELHAILEAKGVFARRLAVEVAYHSHHMQLVSKQYKLAIQHIKPDSGSEVVFYSSVTGERLSTTALDADYWVANMVGQVKFAQAFQALYLDRKAARERRRRTSPTALDITVEIGPHSALAGPIKQIVKSNLVIDKVKPPYFSALMRNIDAEDTIFNLVCQLIEHGYEVDCSAVRASLGNKSSKVLVDLPPYAWNHTTHLWTESRLSSTYKNRKHPRTDLLGVRDVNSNVVEPRWRNVLRPSENPWIRDHKVQGNMVYPAAGFIAMAIEAASQLASDSDVHVQGFSLRNVVIGAALLVAEEGPETEIMITMRPYNESAKANSNIWSEFCIFSVDSTDTWTEHCRGLISAEKPARISEVDGETAVVEIQADYEATASFVLSKSKLETNVDHFYQQLREAGLEYGPAFANLTDVQSGPCTSAGTVVIADTADTMPARFEYPFVVHPSTLDSCLHPLFLAVSEDGVKAAIPTFIEEIFISGSIRRSPGCKLQVYAQSRKADVRQHTTSLLVMDAAAPVIEIKGLVCTELDHADVSGLIGKPKPICFDIQWRPDVDFLEVETLRDFCSESGLLTYVDLLAHKKPGLRILESDPTLSLTVNVLETLGGESSSISRFTCYDSVFASEEYLAQVASRWTGLVNAKPLDFDKELESQGFESSFYDLIVIRDGSVGQHLSALRRLLREGGSLVVLHASQELAVSLEEAGMNLYRNGDFFLAIDATTSRSDVPDINIVACEGSSLVDIEALRRKFDSIGVQTYLTSFDDVEVSDRIAIVLLDASIDPFSNPSENHFEAYKKLFLRGSGSLWVTRGATVSSSSPTANMITGLSRVVRAETAGLVTVTLDLDEQPHSDVDNIFNVVVKSFSLNKSDPSSMEVELVHRKGSIMIPRIMEDAMSNRHIASRTVAPVPHLQPFWQPSRPLIMDVKVPGLLDTLHFKDDIRMYGNLPEDSVEIEVRASGMNFKDVMMAMGQVKTEMLGLECSGVITALGESVVGFQVGDRVATYAQGTYCNRLRQQACAVQSIPDDMTFETATTIPIVFCTAYHSVYRAARLQKDETVLIHAASGGLGQALIMLCQIIGAEVFATVGTKEKKEFLMRTYNIPEDHIFSSRDGTFAKRVMRATSNRGVDVIMNSVAGDALRLTWSCVAPFGRFIELGRRDFELNTRLDMERFALNVGFSAVDFVHLAKDRPSQTGEMWREVMDLFRSNCLQPVQPIAVYPISEAESALRTMQKGRHIGKLVLASDSNPLVKTMPQPVSRDLLRADASYLLVGGLGGIGRAIALWMIAHGARNIIFANRSGMDKREAKDVVKQLEDAGARVRVFSCDVGIEAQVEQMVSDSVQEMPPIRGVIQAAMVLRDGLFAQMSLEDYITGVGPKVQGTWNLHNHLSKTDVDFFIMLSSISGVVGNTSQAQYAAASTFLDAFADYRNSLELPAVTIDLGVVHDVGYVANNKKLQKGFEDQKFEMIESTELLAMLEDAIANPLRENDRSGQTVTGLGTYKPDNSLPVHALPIFSHFRQANTTDIEEDCGNTVIKARDVLKNAQTILEATTGVAASIGAKISSLVMLPVDEISPDRSMAEYGIDSLVAVEMRNWLFREIDVAASILELLANITIFQLAEKLLRRSKLSRSYPAVSPVYTFGDGTWVENLAIRSNGKALVTLLTTPEVWQIDQVSKSASLVHKFGQATGCLGIAETVTDNFYVACGNYSTSTFVATPGSFSIWKIDLTQSSPEITRIANLPASGFLNGATRLTNDIILVADSDLGAVWSVDVATGVVNKVITDPSMLPTATVAPIGINGLHVSGQELVYTQTNNATIWSMPIDTTTGASIGPAKVIASQVTGGDDFTIDNIGDLIIASDAALREVHQGASSVVTIANVDGASSVKFGRTQGDRDMAYISSTGGIECYIGGSCPSAGGLYVVNLA